MSRTHNVPATTCVVLAAGEQEITQDANDSYATRGVPTPNPPTTVIITTITPGARHEEA